MLMILSHPAGKMNLVSAETHGWVRQRHLWLGKVATASGRILGGGAL